MLGALRLLGMGEMSEEGGYFSEQRLPNSFFTNDLHPVTEINGANVWRKELRRGLLVK